MTIDAEHLQGWIGKRDSALQALTPEPVIRLAALLDYAESPWAAGEIPDLGHWLYFLPQVRASEIGEDGHPRLGGFLPPVPLPRRMWAGSRIEFQQPPLIGEIVERESTVVSVMHKSGKSGDLVFVGVEHKLRSERGVLLREHQDIVYREASTHVTESIAPVADELPMLDWRREVQPDPVMLMRFSALTFNAHRIHYDRDYAREQEGYAGLVVHGPLTATLLMDLFRRNTPQARIAAFSFRGLRPLLDTAPVTLVGRALAGGAELWALDHHGRIAMSATLEVQS